MLGEMEFRSDATPYADAAKTQRRLRLLIGVTVGWVAIALALTLQIGPRFGRGESAIAALALVAVATMSLLVSKPPSRQSLTRAWHDRPLRYGLYALAVTQVVDVITTVHPPPGISEANPTVVAILATDPLAFVVAKIAMTVLIAVNLAVLATLRALSFYRWLSLVVLGALILIMGGVDVQNLVAV